ncbi:MAG TPA: hypothetical protein VFX70_11800 [Mycobacteriales bacterium]|nr:hypothetical protein [Mycobacteriales bacterium]
MSDKVMHEAAGWLSTELVLTGLNGFTACGKWIRSHGAPLGSPPCPKCTRILAEKRAKKR